MNTIEQQKGEMEDSNLPQDVANQTQSVDESRRRFTKSGVVASGVLLTLASRPSLGGGGGGGGGGGWVCKSPSGFLSANLSQHGTPKTCGGRTPGYWCTHTTWPSPYKVGTCTNTKFKQSYNSWSGGTMYKDSNLGFHCTGYGAGYLKYSMLQVGLLGGNGDPYQLGAHCVAALLNARMGWTPVLTEAQVRAMFNDYASYGYYEPTAGVKWYPADIVTYLKSTMTL
jgi:hypothetical protein